MVTRPYFPRGCWALTAALTFCPAVSAQAPPSLLNDLDSGQPLLGRDQWLASQLSTSVPGAQQFQSSTPRFRLFRMMPGFLSDPLGLDAGDDTVAPKDDPALASMKPNLLDSSEPNWINVSIGQDNPWFDLRRPGDPGGIGYYRLYSQVQLADLGNTSICLGLNAVTPSGQQDGGLQSGPTILTPGVSVFHDLGNGLALQGYVGQNFRASLRDDLTDNALNCSMGFQCPMPLLTTRQDQGVYLFVQALANYNYDSIRASNGGHATNWEFIPGVHYRLNPNCWMSLGASMNGNGLLTCLWQF